MAGPRHIGTIKGGRIQPATPESEDSKPEENYRSIGTLKGAIGIAKKREKDHTAKRARAPHILLPKEIETGNWDAKKILLTTLGEEAGEWGQKRLLSQEDLDAFGRNVEALGKRYTGGITPKDIIDTSYPNRRERAQEQIHMAVPYKGDTTKNGTAVIRFRTNAGPDCKHKPKQHHVSVELIDFNEAVASKSPASQTAQWLRKRKIRFDCDCEDHTFRFRYIATVGKFNFGRNELGYPRVRNPHLKGLACKHVIRVARLMQVGGVVGGFLARLIDTAKSHHMGTGKAVTSQKEADKIAAKQTKRPGKIKGAEERKTGPRAVKEAAKVKKEVVKAIEKKPPALKKPGRQTAEMKKQAAEAVMRMALKAQGMTDKQVDKMLRDLVGTPTKATKRK